MAEQVAEQRQSLITLDHTEEKMPDWSLLPEELLHLISTFLENCVDVVHARSVCNPWRSSFPFPSCLLRPSYSLPMLSASKHDDSYTLVKIPLFLFRVLTPLGTAASHSEYILGGIRQDDHMEILPSPVQCSVKSDQTMNMLDCQIIPLGHQFRMMEWAFDELTKEFRDVCYLQLNKEEGGFVMFINFCGVLFVMRSAEMRVIKFKKINESPCMGLVAFRGKFYAVFVNGEKFVIDPYSLEETLLLPSSPRLNLRNYLVDYFVACGNDELFYVEKDFNEVPSCRVSRLDEETGKWVVVNDLGNRVLFIDGPFGNVSCSAKELPDGCGISGNSILFTHKGCSETFFFKYGVHSGNVEDDLSALRSSIQNRVTILNKSFSVLALRVQC